MLNRLIVLFLSSLVVVVVGVGADGGLNDKNRGGISLFERGRAVEEFREVGCELLRGSRREGELAGICYNTIDSREDDKIGTATDM